MGEQGLEVELNKRVENLSELERCFVELGKHLLSGFISGHRGQSVKLPGEYELYKFQRMLKRSGKGYPFSILKPSRSSLDRGQDGPAFSDGISARSLGGMR